MGLALRAEQVPPRRRRGHAKNNSNSPGIEQYERSNSPMNFPLLSASNLLRVLFALLILTSSLILLKKASSSPPPAQKVQEVPAATRRLFENRVPEHLP